jgi:hypothetical protein
MEIRERHFRESGNPDGSEIPEFRVALAIASLPGMTTVRATKFNFGQVIEVELACFFRISDFCRHV